MRPESLDEFLGQSHLLHEGSLLRRSIETDQSPSMILWGPPGSGKTSLAYVIAQRTAGRFVKLSAVTSGVKELRKVVDTARAYREKKGEKTILFVDEIHRWNKAQQDGLLPYVEDGTITLIGATTENPSFYVISPLLSRCRTFTLKPLGSESIMKILERALADGRGLADCGAAFSTEALEAIVNGSDGDARRALNDLEIVSRTAAETAAGKEITADFVSEALKNRHYVYDKAGEEHYNVISALHKSVRGSDPDGALYWLARMLVSGEDALYVARRLIRMAVEDVGLASPQALTLAISAMECYRFLGSPEGELALAEAAVYMATCPKSNSIYAAMNEVKEEIRKSGSIPVPLHIRNAPTDLMKSLDYGKDYKYDHDHEDAYAGQEFLPEQLKGRKFYHPTDRGFEKQIGERLEYWKKLKQKRAE
jgi:putative ATPase